VLASSSSTSHATSLRGSPDVVLASMNYVLKDAEQEIRSTEKDLQEKKDAFKGRVIDEKKVAEKARKVVQIAKECIKDATAKRDDAKKQIVEFTSKLIKQSLIDFTRTALQAAEDGEGKAKKEFQREEAIFHHDMSHLEAVKNESTRIIGLLNDHYTNKQNIAQGGGVVKPKATLSENDDLQDLIPNPARGHVNIGLQQTSNKKAEVKKEQAKKNVKDTSAPAIVKNKKPAKPIPVPKAETNNVVALLQMAQHNGLGDYEHIIRHLQQKPVVATMEEKKKATTKVPYQNPDKNSPKYHARVPSTEKEESTEKEMSADSKAEKGRVKEEEDIKQADGGKLDPNAAKKLEPQASAGKLKLTALGKKVNVGKDVGGHVIAAMTKLHGFISDHSNNREEAFELATKHVRTQLAKARSEMKRLTALIADYVKTNAALQKNINDFKQLVTQNQMQIDQCKLDMERGNLGELDAKTKVTHILTDLKKLTKSYKNVVGDFKNERSTAEYVIKMVKSKIVKLRKFLESAQNREALSKKNVTEHFVDPDLPLYHGLKEALECDPNASPEEWCKSPKMMVRCGVTKESCDTFHFQKLAMPPHATPEADQATKTDWKTTKYKEYKAGQKTVDARSEAEKKRDLTPDEQK
jgi:hypothetical protein